MYIDIVGLIAIIFWTAIIAFCIGWKKAKNDNSILEKRVKELEAIERLSKDSIMRLYDSKEQAESHLTRLQEAVDRHRKIREAKIKTLEEIIKEEKMDAGVQRRPEDEELYKVRDET